MRTVIPLGLVIRSVEYVLYAFCAAGWGLAVIMAVCCLGGLEQPTTHALMSAEVPSAKQGALHGAITVSISSALPSFAFLFGRLFSCFLPRNRRNRKRLYESSFNRIVIPPTNPSIHPSIHPPINEPMNH